METLRFLMMLFGWPLLVLGSVVFVTRSVQFYRTVGKKVWGKLVVAMVIGWVISMYSLATVATIYIFTDVKGVVIVLPIFFVWLVTMIVINWAIQSWSKEAIKLGSSYERLEKLVKERTKELDETAKVLVRRDLELTETNERLRDLDEIKSQFVSVAAHQLRTPLTGIKWTLWSLLEERVGKMNTEQKKFAGDAYKSTNRLIDLINDLLNISRLEEGRFGFLIKRQALVPIIQGVYKKFVEPAAKKGIILSLDLPKEKIPLLELDEEKIAIALENFVDNAVKYTSPGGAITVTVLKEENNVSVEVQDTGIGMPQEDISQVFTKFFRAENAQLYQTSGTGLGLYLTKNIVEHHKGAIFFKTKENEGSTFSFTLPIPKDNK